MDYKKVPQQINDVVGDNVKKLAQLFPSAVKDGEVDFEALKEELGSFSEVGAEKYELTWAGKADAKRIAREDIIGKTLKYVPEDSKDADSTENLYIEGDNLEVLKLLRQNYYGAIKMIYIDPPYNTGNDFIYNDSFEISQEESDELEGTLGEDGERYTVNLRTSNRFHAKWLSNMYSRLMIAKDLLKDDGVIFISIDDNELDNLLKLCNEVFGEKNYINTISVFTKVSAGASGGGEDKKLKKNIEYVILFAKNVDSLNAMNSIYKETELMDYIEQMKRDNKSFKYTNVLYRCEDIVPYGTTTDGDGDIIEISKVNDYEIKTIKQIAKEEGITEKEVYYKYYDKIMTTTNAQTSIRDRVWQATDSENNMYIASYVTKSGKNKGKKISIIFMGKQKVLVIWLKDTAVLHDGVIYKREKVGTFWDGFSWINVSKEGALKFDNGKKPIAFIQRMLQLVPNDEDMTVLDFFSGSGTVAHAVMQESSENPERKIKCISIQIREEIKPTTKANKDYLAYLKEEKVTPIITEIGKERIRRAGEKIKSEHPDIDTGFKVFRVADTNIKWNSIMDMGQLDVSQIESDPYSMDFMPNTKDIDVVYELMLRQRDVALSESVELLSDIGNRTYLYASSFLVCLETEVTESLVEKIAAIDPLPIKFIFRDSAFKDDIALKDETFRRLKVLVEKNSGESKPTYTVEFI